MAQAITTQAQDVTTQDQAFTAQANMEIVPRAKQHVGTIASHSKDFTMMNPPTLYGSKVEKYLKDLFDEIYMILYTMGLTTREKAELAINQLKDVDQTWYIQ